MTAQTIVKQLVRKQAGFKLQTLTLVSVTNLLTKIVDAGHMKNTRRNTCTGARYAMPTG